MKKTHRESGWAREHIGHNRWHIIPTDGTGEREVAFMGAGSWGNLANDDRANEGKDRVVLVSGDALPEWAQVWLTTVNHNEMEKARENFRAALQDADDNEWARLSDAY